MALIGKKKKIVAGHYEYRGYEVKKNGSSWNVDLDSETLRTEKTLGKACEEVDIILGSGTDAKSSNIVGKKDTKVNINITDSTVYSELSNKIVSNLNIGNPTSIVPSDTNHSLRWNNFKGNIEEITSILDKIMIDYEKHSIDLHHSKDLLFVTITFANSEFAVKNKSKTTEDKPRQSSKELSEIASNCKDVCISVSETLMLENPNESFNEYAYTHIYHTFKGDKEEALKTVDTIRNDYPNFEIRIYIGLNVCYLTVCRKK